MTKLHEITQLGQQIWLDNLSRSLVSSGELAEQLNSGISGVTSNPFIFYHSIKSDPLYAEDVAWLKTQEMSKKERYEQLAVVDIQAACDVFLPLYHESKMDKGYVSLEVAPELAHNVEGTVAEAKKLWEAVNRPNLMIKVPATPAGIIAVTDLISLGINVNVTLIFSRTTALHILEAYTAGLDLRHKAGTYINDIRLVASFFMSRIDSALDNQLPPQLKGKSAIAVAKAAYSDWAQFCAQPLFVKLETSGALRPSLLWASTGTKNHEYSDVLYVDALIGADTVNTLPEKTLHAFLDHGTVKETLPQNTPEAFATIAQIEQLGIDFDQLGIQLQNEGLQQFEQAFAAMLDLLD